MSTFGIWSNKTEGTAGFERAVVEQKGDLRLLDASAGNAPSGSFPSSSGLFPFFSLEGAGFQNHAAKRCPLFQGFGCRSSSSNPWQWEANEELMGMGFP